MLNDETLDRLRQFVRATFPYLVFIGVFILGMICVMIWAAADALPTPVLPRAHAHNDYEHPRPLLDALDHGFCSVEADIHLVDGALLVAHDREDVDRARTLDRLYLAPLWTRFKQFEGRIYPEPAAFTLLIDIKSDGTETYRALEKELADYAPMLTEFTDDRTKTRAVTVIISGNRDEGAILGSNPRYAGIDGRLPDLDGPLNPNHYPLVSDNWFKHFKWLGNTGMKAEEAKKLDGIVAKAREHNVRLRFWAIPQSPAMWGRLYDAGVDLLNADDLTALREVLLEKAAK